MRVAKTRALREVCAHLRSETLTVALCITSCAPENWIKRYEAGWRQTYFYCNAAHFRLSLDLVLPGIQFHLNPFATPSSVKILSRDPATQQAPNDTYSCFIVAISSFILEERASISFLTAAVDCCNAADSFLLRIESSVFSSDRAAR